MTPRKHILDIIRETGFRNKPVEADTHFCARNDEDDKQLFAEWEKAEEYVYILERVRDTNAPKTPDDDWNDAFCLAIEMIPDAKRYADDCWWNYYGRRNGE
jgi:hypothetical protein